MKVIKKISLHRGLNRIIEPSLNYPRMTRYSHKQQSPYTLTPQQQLHKYSVKPNYFEFSWIMGLMVGSVGALFWIVYSQELYKNQLDTIYRYRYHQEEIGSTKLYLRIIALKTMFYFEENFFLGAFFKKNNLGGQEMDYFTQGMIRYAQYQNFIHKKDRKFDFLDLGVLEKFPYPKRNAPAGME